MPAYHEYLINMPDGTIKQINPLTGTEVWSVPGRGHRPLGNGKKNYPHPQPRMVPESYCDFCPPNILRTPPEKDRLILENGMRRNCPHLLPNETSAMNWLFRRVSNLFEIVRLDYWAKNYSYRLDEETLSWRSTYLDSREGKEHVLSTVDYKLRLMGKSDQEIAEVSEKEKLRLADPFFGGTHELIIANRHFLPGDGEASELFSSGDLSYDEHFEYFKFTIEALRDIYDHNRYIRYVTVFQNWLPPAGASFDHLHRQLVGLDEWGTALEWEMARVRQNPNIYNELLVNFAAHTNRVIAENDHAIAFVAIGHRFPTLAIYSKSAHLRPYELEEEELRGVSDLVHALHAALGRYVSCNEEWYYAPRDCVDTIPWHVLLKLRVNTPAGFEGGTRIYINPYSPYELRDKVVPALYSMRYEGRVRVKTIAEECPVEPNSLRYLNLRNL